MSDEKLDPIVLEDGTSVDPSDGDVNWTKPSRQWQDMTDAQRDAATKELHEIGFDTIVEHWQDIERFIGDTGGVAKENAFNPQYQSIFIALSSRPNLMVNAVRFFPRLHFIYEKWVEYMKQMKQNQAVEANDPNPGVSFEDYMKAFTNDPDVRFLWDEGSIGTQTKIAKWLDEHSRPDTDPPPVNPWELRLGGSRFFVPPISINVNTSFRAGSMTGGALRQPNSPKFNSGHSDTTISMTIYFPNQESIWGTSEYINDINFEDDSDVVVDNFMSSLRGLVAQFKYSPILPIRNDFLNRTYGITGVTLQGMTVQTLPKYPFCLAVTLELTSFNHKVFLPMLNDFNQAIRWGRFRQYIGRAAQKMNSYVNMGFLVETAPEGSQGTKLLEYEASPTTRFSKLRDLDTTTDAFNPNKFQIYYPNQTPAKIFSPDTYTWRQYNEDSSVNTSQDLWAQFLETLGYEVQDNPEAIYDYLKDFDQSHTTTPARGVTEQDLLMEYLRAGRGNAIEMTPQALEAYLAKRLAERAKEFAPNPYTSEQRDSDTEAIRIAWFSFLFNSAGTSPRFKDYIEQEKARRQQFIKEWEIPMTKMDIDWSKVIVQGVSVSLGNNFARLQLQMQSEPVYQHIGGRDATVNVSMIVFGEEELIRFQRIFEHVNGLARLEHAHGILGFLGIKNVLTTLCGMKYVLPLSFETASIPNYPHAYSVNMSLVDFDIFQQRREELSSEQQKQFIEAFGTKRNPFLRVKQLWGAFNAYPDFPLAVFENDPETNTSDPSHPNDSRSRKIIGHLDPDFYFKSFETIDDDLVQHNLETRPHLSGAAQGTEQRSSRPEDGVNPSNPKIIANTVQNDAPTVASSVVALPSDQVSSVGDKIWAADALAMKVYFPVFGEGQNQMGGVIIKKGDVALANIDTNKGQFNVVGSKDGKENGGGFAPVLESHAGHTLDKPVIGKGEKGGLVPFSDYGNPTVTKPGKTISKNDPAYHVEQMMYDAQYRNKSGRMIRAFPTFMLWLIDEGGHFAGVKLFDNFYGLQSVIDFSVHSSEDILGDTLVLRLSNLYSKLNTPYTKIAKINPDGSETPAGSSISGEDNLQDYLSDPYTIDDAIDNMLINKNSLGYDNLLSGTQDTFIRELSGIRLKPGVRVHLRMGYSANPNSLQTVFNGTITEVALGEIVEVTAQSDAIELAPYVNTTDKEGDSGHIDGAFNTGLWMSEPRDLMVRLLSMGSSTFREAFAYATQGLIFSENKFGIRHFGQILYEPLSDGENQRHSKVNEAVSGSLSSAINLQTGDTSTSSQGLGDILTMVTGGGFDAISGTSANVRSSVLPIMQMLWVNSMRHRDYELFKRNIYPGNGSGVAQYLGGDFPEAGLMMAEAAGADGGSPPTVLSAEANQFRAIERAKRGQIADTQKKDDAKENQPPAPDDKTDPAKNKSSAVDPNSDKSTNAVGSTWDLFASALSGNLDNNPLWRAMGITNDGDDDLKGFDEVSFRAQTYMKSVWDLFRLCAALLPNYVVAVRPFEDRSTVFYGKPHWLYTSGVVPVTNGLPKKSKMDEIKPDKEEADLLAKLQNAANPLSDFQSQQKLLESLNKVTAINPAPAASTAGIAFKGGDVKSLPGEMGGAVLPVRQGKTVCEMHLPTSDNLEEDKAQHKQLADLPANRKHPYYMDRAGGPAGGYTSINSATNPDPSKETVLNENAALPGQHGAAGLLSPEEEQWYFNMRWPFVDWHEVIDGKNTFRPDTKGSDYFHKRVAIQNAQTGATIVAVIGESGPYLAGGCAAGMSPDCWHALGLEGQADTTCYFGFVDQSTALGPASGDVTGKNQAQQASTTPAAAPPARNSGPSGENQDANKAAKGIVKELGGKEALDIINKGGDPGAAQSYLRGWNDANFNVWGVNGIVNSDEAYGKDKEHPEAAKDNFNADPVGHFARLLYDREYAARFKTWVDNKEVDPSALLGQADANFAGFFKDLGQLELFAGNDSDAKPGDVVKLAEAIWDQFRDQWYLRPESDGKYKEIQEAIKTSSWNASIDFMLKSKDRGMAKSLDQYHISDKEYWEGAAKNSDQGKPIFDDAKDKDEFYDYLPNALVGSFKKFMWQNPYARAWLVVTTSFHTSLGTSPGSFFSSLIEKVGNVAADAANTATTVAGPAGVAGHIVLGDEGWKKVVSWVASDELCDFSHSTVIEAFKKFLEITYQYEMTDDKDHKSRDPNSDNAGFESINYRKADGSMSQAATEMVKWMQAHSDPGLKSSNPIDRIKEEISRTYDGTIGHLLSVAGNTLTSLIGAFRLQMQQLSIGLNMVGNMQRQAHVLNKVLNDSIYYAEGVYLPDGSPDLLKSVDNPFTREYGEPVVEIREPFQRLHYIDSYQHILNNGIQETLSGVATVVTASSDGKYPVSVYFDKGAPTNLQTEKAVETGLFWDNAKGEGFFSFLHPLIHPMEAIRGYTKIAQGSSDELLSKRVALWHLKESLKDIYSGEIIVLGDPDIRAHDLVYIADVYERMYGLVEVEAVTHHFTSDDGFITAITPNAVVTINDPSRWTITHWISALWGVKNIRDDTRNYLQVFADNTSPVYNKEWITTRDLAEALRVPILGHTTFTGGASGVVKDLVSAKATGFLATEAERTKLLSDVKAQGEKKTDNPLAGGTQSNPFASSNSISASAQLASNLPGVNLIADLGWDIWDWVRDNLMDQHGCYIQYLTRDGQPMDAGLSYAQGVAVGRAHTIELLPNILGLTVPVKEGGHARITTNDLLAQLGWNEIDTAHQYKEMSWWVAQTNSRILDQTGLGPDSYSLESAYVVNLVRVTKIEDGDTLHGVIIGGDYLSPNATNPGLAGEEIAFRFSGVRLFELSNHTNPDHVPEDDPGRRAREYLASICPVGTVIAVRQVRGKEKEFYGRDLAVLFNNIPRVSNEDGQTSLEQREVLLMGYAGRVPIYDGSGNITGWKPSSVTPAPWDGYLDDGQPYTLNWQMIMAGYGDVDTVGISQADTDRGAIFGPGK